MCWAHLSHCFENNLHVRHDGPQMPPIKLPAMDAMMIIEARLSKQGALDCEANFEWLFISLLREVMGYRLEAFKDLVNNHKLLSKFSIENGAWGGIWHQCISLEADCQWTINLMWTAKTCKFPKSG